MTKARRITFSLLLVVLAATAAAGQDNRCYVCSKTGFVPCEDKACKRQKCAFEFEHRCSDQLELPCCRGFKKIPCKFCTNNDNHATFKAELEERKAWLDADRAHKKEIKTPSMVHIQSNAFHLWFDLKKVKVRQKVYLRMDAAHLYATRLEELLEDYKKLFGEPYQYPRADQRWTVYMAKNLRDRERVTSTVLSGSATKLFSTHKPIYVVGFTRGEFSSDKLLHANVYHHTSHLILQQGFPIGQQAYPGWFTVGVAHWMEDNKFETKNFCHGEVAPNKDKWQMGKWPNKIYTAVRKDKEPRLASFAKRDTRKLDPPLHAFSWSMIDFIMKRHPEKAGDLSRSITAGASTAEALNAHFGWSVERFHDEWRRYVEKAYAR